MRQSFLLLTLFLLSSLSQAGPVETGIVVCGKTAPFYRLNDEFTLAVFGNANNDVKEARFRLVNLNGVDRNLNKPMGAKSAAVSDLLSAASIADVSICIHGDLETRKVPSLKIPSQFVTVYYLTPQAFQIDENNDTWLNPSDLKTRFGYQSGSPQEFSPPPRLTWQFMQFILPLEIVSFEDEEHGEKYGIAGLNDVLSAPFFKDCAPLEKAAQITAALAFPLTRKDKLKLKGSKKVACSDTVKKDVLLLEVEFLRSDSQDHRIIGTLTLERPEKKLRTKLSLVQQN